MSPTVPTQRHSHAHSCIHTHTYTFQLIRQGLETHHCLAPGECQQHWVLCSHRGRIVCPRAFSPPVQERRRLPLFTGKFCVRKRDAPSAAWSVECTACQHGVVSVTSEHRPARRIHGCVPPLTCCQESMAGLVLPNAALWRNTDSSLLIKM